MNQPISRLPGEVYVWMEGMQTACRVTNVPAVELDQLEALSQLGLDPNRTYIIHGIIDETQALVSASFTRVVGIMVFRDQGVLQFASNTQH
jgi:hypothetical protein